MLPNVPGYREYDFISISKSEYNELKEQNSKRIVELLGKNASLVAALEELLTVAKHYKPIPKGYNPEDEDEEMWAIGQVYYQAEQALAPYQVEFSSDDSLIH